MTRGRPRTDAIDALYTAPPAAFTGARNALARRLRDAGHTAQALSVGRLRKPTVPVWAINQLARRERGALASFVKAVQRLERAQMGKGGALAEAMAAERAARRDLLARTGAILADAGLRPSTSVTRRMSDTLLATASDPRAREALLRGRLDEEREPPGFGLLEGAVVATRRAGGRERPARAPRGDEAKRAREARVNEERARRQARASTLKAARHARAADRAAAQAENLRRRLQQLESRVQHERELARSGGLEGPQAPRARRRPGGAGAPLEAGHAPED
jgi:hypothetical protein